MVASRHGREVTRILFDALGGETSSSVVAHPGARSSREFLNRNGASASSGASSGMAQRATRCTAKYQRGSVAFPAASRAASMRSARRQRTQRKLLAASHAPGSRPGRVARTVGPAGRGALAASRWCSATAATAGLRLRALILIRWIAIVGQAFTIALVHFSLEFRAAARAAVRARSRLSALINLVPSPRASRRPPD